MEKCIVDHLVVIPLIEAPFHHLLKLTTIYVDTLEHDARGPPAVQGRSQLL